MSSNPNAEYNCACGFSCKKSHNFLNHKNICKAKNLNHLETILKSYTNSYSTETIITLGAWWNKYSDRKFMLELYPKIGEYLGHMVNPCILDIGFEDYNIINKDLLLNPNIAYYQLEPFFQNKIYNNDKLLECKVDELSKKYSEYKKHFDIINDFGVLGFPPISKNWDEEQFKEYINNIHYALKDNGIYILKIDQPYFDMKESNLDFEKIIYPYFEPITFLDYASGIHIRSNNNVRRPMFALRDQSKFFFLKKKIYINNLVFVAHPDDESIWCEEKLNENTHVVVVFGSSKLGITITHERAAELKNAMNITKSSYEIWNFSEKNKYIDRKGLAIISKKIMGVLDYYKDAKTIYTHNQFGEYGHIDHIRMHQIMKKVFGNYYKNINNIPEIYQFYPHLNYESKDCYKNIPYVDESARRKMILDQFKSQSMTCYRNVKLDFTPFILDN